MNWKLKAAIQNTVALLPSSTSYALYYWLQRHFGGLRRTDPTNRIMGGIEIWRRAVRSGFDPVGKTIYEVGTGWVPNVPMAYWLMGAGKIITMDVNPYMKAELAQESLAYVAGHADEYRKLFGDLLIEERFRQLLEFHQKGLFSLPAFLTLCSIVYAAPGDATCTALAPKSIDFYTSYGVLNHIPLPALKKVIAESIRITKDDGIFVQRIDYSDTFSHSDRNITAINFLQYSDQQWKKYAGNRYMYTNRLRHDDFVKLFEEAGQRILATDPDIDQRVIELVKSGRFHLDEQFKDKSLETLSNRSCWIVAKKANA